MLTRSELKRPFALRPSCLTNWDPAQVDAVTLVLGPHHKRSISLESLANSDFREPKQRFKPFGFLAAQPHNILLYRNLLRSLPRQSLATKANH
jgi:hypothetical protein